MKAGEAFVCWLLLTAMVCLAVGVEAVNRTWPTPSQDRMDNATAHLQEAMSDVGWPTAGMVIAVVAAYAAMYLLGGVLLVMLLVEAVRWVRDDSQRRREALAEAQARFTTEGGGQ